MGHHGTPWDTMGHHGIPWASQMSQMNCLFACDGSHGSVMASSAEDLPEERRETFAVLAVLRVLRGLLCMNLLNLRISWVVVC